MIIIVEGADGVGKTTLAKQLAKHFGYKYKHFGIPKNQLNAKKQYFSVLKKNENIVCDRFWLGEYVYAPLFRHYEPVFKEEFEKYIHDNGIKIIFLLVTASGYFVSQHNKNNDLDLLGKHELIQTHFILKLIELKVPKKYLLRVQDITQEQVFETAVNVIKKYLNE